MPEIYGIWDADNEWWCCDNTGIVFHTPYPEVAQAQLETLASRANPHLDVLPMHHGAEDGSWQNVPDEVQERTGFSRYSLYLYDADMVHLILEGDGARIEIPMRMTLFDDIDTPIWDIVMAILESFQLAKPGGKLGKE